MKLLILSLHVCIYIHRYIQVVDPFGSAAGCKDGRERERGEERERGGESDLMQKAINKSPR